MRKVICLILTTIIAVVVAGCVSSVVKSDTMIEFENGEFYFGDLELNGDGICSFSFTNTGKAPLVISRVETLCGCTVPKWPEKPIKPGKGGEIKIAYDTSHPGVFHRWITVHYNGQESPEILSIAGNVKNTVGSSDN